MKILKIQEQVIDRPFRRNRILRSKKYSRRKSECNTLNSVEQDGVPPLLIYRFFSVYDKNTIYTQSTEYRSIKSDLKQQYVCDIRQTESKGKEMKEQRDRQSVEY